MRESNSVRPRTLRTSTIPHTTEFVKPVNNIFRIKALNYNDEIQQAEAKKTHNLNQKEHLLVRVLSGLLLSISVDSNEYFIAFVRRDIHLKT